MNFTQEELFYLKQIYEPTMSKAELLNNLTDTISIEENSFLDNLTNRINNMDEIKLKNTILKGLRSLPIDLEDVVREEY